MQSLGNMNQDLNTIEIQNFTSKENTPFNGEIATIEKSITIDEYLQRYRDEQYQ
jgi:hypothetical protein